MVEFVNAAHRDRFLSEARVGQPIRAVRPDPESAGFTARVDEVFRTGESLLARAAPTVWRDPRTGQAQTRYLDFTYAPPARRGRGDHRCLLRRL